MKKVIPMVLEIDQPNLKKTKTKLIDIYTDKTILFTDQEKKALESAILLINDIEKEFKQEKIKS